MLSFKVFFQLFIIGFISLMISACGNAGDGSSNTNNPATVLGTLPNGSTIYSSSSALSLSSGNSTANSTISMINGSAGYSYKFTFIVQSNQSQSLAAKLKGSTIGSLPTITTDPVECILTQGTNQTSCVMTANGDSASNGSYTIYPVATLVGVTTANEDHASNGDYAISQVKSLVGDGQSTTLAGIPLTVSGNVNLPVITSISPSYGSVDGGTSVTVHGSNFTNATQVKFGNVQASFIVNSNTQITAISPSNNSEIVDIVVTTPDGTSTISANDQFTYIPLPTVTSISPNSGPTSGGSTVTITGTNFTGATRVMFGSVSATSFTINSSTQITANSPAGSAGTVNITVITSGGTSIINANDQFTYGVAPNISGISPNSGPTSGGSTVTITGANFNGATQVMFGNISATGFTVDSSTQITATSPAGSAVTVNITVTTSGGTSIINANDQFTYGVAPNISGIAPNSGPTSGGSTVTITGANFIGATQVMFGSSSATGFTVNSSTQITATSPVGSAGAVDITVTTSGGSSAISVADEYTYVLEPTVTSISPNSGPTSGAVSVTITGTNFTDATQVMFGNSSATSFIIDSSTQITATSPAGSAGTVDITVTTSGGNSAINSADEYTYVLEPTVTSISPNSGPTSGGVSVTITGTNFTDATQVMFGSSSAIGFIVDSSTQITAISPAGSAGTVDITVTTSGGSSAISSADQFTYGVAPSISGISPNSGPTSGGNTVTITGANFINGATVMFGNSSATNVTVDSSTQITATSPAGSAGTVDITVTTSGGSSATNPADEYTYALEPTVTSIFPNLGSTSGGDTVIITGTNFNVATQIMFGSSSATSFIVDSNTQITATSPAGSAGTVDITVTTPGGTSATNPADQFTYQ